MSKKIGEILLEKRLISPLQLDKALRNQLVLGGHLGTCLIELGYIDEREFGRTLAEAHGLGYAEPETLRDIDPDLIGLFTWKMAEKYQMVPFELKDRRLHVAVIDPRNVDGISRLAQCEVVPFVSPELRIYEAMETFYDIERRPRYIKLCNRLESLGTDGDPATTQPLPRVSERTDDASPEDTSRATTGQPDPSSHDSTGRYKPVRSWRDVAEELFEPSPENRDTAIHQPSTNTPSKEVEPSESSAGDLYARLRRVEHVNELSEIVLEHLASRAGTCILFRVKAEAATIWDWHGIELTRAGARSVVFPVTSGSLFTLMRGDGVYIGPATESIDCRWFYTALRFEIPLEILLVPVYIEDRLVAIIYADGGAAGRVQGTVAEYEVLARSLSLTFQMLILKAKIGATRG